MHRLRLFLLLAVAATGCSKPRTDTPRDWLEKARAELAAVDATEDRQLRHAALTWVATTYSRAGEIEAAAAWMREIEDEETAQTVARRIVSDLALCGNLDAARRWADEFCPDYERLPYTFAKANAVHGHPAAAVVYVRGLTDAEEVKLRGVGIGWALAGAGCFHEAREVASTLPPDDSDSILQVIASKMAADGDRAAADAVVQEIAGEYARRQAGQWLPARQLSAAFKHALGDPDKRMEYARWANADGRRNGLPWTGTPGHYVRLLKPLVEALEHASDEAVYGAAIKRAAEAASAAGDPLFQAMAWLHIAAAHCRAGQDDAVRAAVDRVVTLSEESGSNYHHGVILPAAVVILVRAGDIESARDIVDGFADRREALGSVKAFAYSLVEHGHGVVLDEWFATLETPTERLFAAVGAAIALADARRAGEASAEAGQIP